MKEIVGNQEPISASDGGLNKLDIKKKYNLDSYKKEETDLKNEETKLLSKKNILYKDEFKKKVILFKEKVSK